jgi:hypothetical protein
METITPHGPQCSCAGQAKRPNLLSTALRQVSLWRVNP